MEFLLKGVLVAELSGNERSAFGNCVVGERNKKCIQGERSEIMGCIQLFVCVGVFLIEFIGVTLIKLYRFKAYNSIILHVESNEQKRLTNKIETEEVWM